MSHGRVIYELKGVKSVKYPSEVVYFDCETTYDPDIKDQTHGFRLAVAVSQRYKAGVKQGRAQYATFYRAHAFWDWLEGRCHQGRTVWVIAHNLDFDFGAVEGFSQLTNRGWEVKFFAFSSFVFLLRAEKNGLRLQFVDSGGYFRASLKTLGSRLGLDKLPMPSQSEANSVWEEYCTRDVEVLKLAMEGFVEYLREHDLGKLAYTASGQSMAAYRHRFMTDKITVHRLPRIMAWERQAYHGGRTEAFQLGTIKDNPIYYLDVNSMYASVMVDKGFPCELQAVHEKPRACEITEGLNKFELLADCELVLDEPCVPVKMGRVCFPVGKVRTWLAGEELRYCWDRGYVRKVYTMLVYRRGRPFDRYVEWFWGQRQEAKQQEDPLHNWFCKLLLNSLYGKWAQVNPIYKQYPNLGVMDEGLYEMIDGASGKLEVRLVFGNKVWIPVGEKPAYHSFFPLSVWVTAAARVKLWQLIQTAGKSNVFYCDTDSLFVNQSGYDNLAHLIVSNELGKLDVREKGTSLVIHGAKDYELDDTIRIKGVPVSAKKINENVYSYTTFLRTRARWQKGLQDNVVQKEVVKVLSRKYTKGLIAVNGRVKPFRLPRLDIELDRINRSIINKKLAYELTQEDELYDRMRVEKVYLKIGMDTYTAYRDGLPFSKRILTVTGNVAAKAPDEWADEYHISVSTLIRRLDRACYVKDRHPPSNEEWPTLE